jgi:hypothetical protein
MTKPEDIAAFPYSVEIRGPQDDPFNESDPVPAGISRTYAFAGMSIRDYFAAKAMQGLLASNAPMTSAVKGTALVSQAAYLMADAMLEERSKA